MARWRLTASHYLTVKGNSWEQIEADQMTGRQLRKQYPVPMQLDIADPVVWNGNILRNPRGEILGGDIIVAYEDKAHEPKDYLFVGTPTPDMFPLDDEAKEISAGFEKVWNAKPDEEVQYGQKLVEQLMSKRAEMESEDKTVKIEGMSEILMSLKDMMQQNQQLLTALMAKSEPTQRRA